MKTKVLLSVSFLACFSLANASINIDDSMSAGIVNSSAMVWDIDSISNMWMDMANDMMWNMWAMMDWNMDGLEESMKELDANMADMMKWFETWQENFDDMMNDFEEKLQSDLAAMEERINSMMENIMSDLEEEMNQMEKELVKISDELPTKIVWSLDNRLDSYFSKLESKTTWSEEYIWKLDKLTDKIDTLKESWKIESELLLNAVDYIWTKANLSKQETVTNEVINVQNKDTKDVSKEDLEAIKWLFDMLEVE